MAQIFWMSYVSLLQTLDEILLVTFKFLRQSSVLNPSRLVRLMYLEKEELQKDIRLGELWTSVDSKALLLIIEDKINFNLGSDNRDYQTNKL